MSRKILVTGSTGKTGSRIYSRLMQKGVDAIPATRNSTVPFDWYDANTWDTALTGVDSVYIAFQPDLAVPASLAIITNFTEAAKKAGIQKLVLLSGRGEAEAMACEQVVMHCGLDWTILRASFFMQNFSEGFWVDGITAREFVIPIVKAKEPFVDADDIADMAVEALLNNDHHNKVYELTGPELLSFKDTVEKISDGLQSPVKLVEVPLDEYAAMLSSYQVPDEVVLLIRYLFEQVLDGRNESVKSDIADVLQRKAGSFDQFVSKTLATGQWG